VVQLYDALFALAGSPVVAINRALAIAEVHGTSAALAAMQEVAADGRLAEYQPYWAARAELLARRVHTPKPAMLRNRNRLERDASVRRFLQQRQSALAPDLSRSAVRNFLNTLRGRARSLPFHDRFSESRGAVVIGDAAVRSAPRGVIDDQNSRLRAVSNFR